MQETPRSIVTTQVTMAANKWNTAIMHKESTKNKIIIMIVSINHESMNINTYKKLINLMQEYVSKLNTSLLKFVVRYPKNSIIRKGLKL